MPASMRSLRGSPHLRLVVLDDGSTDGTDAVLANRSGDPRLTVVQVGRCLAGRLVGQGMGVPKGCPHFLESEDAPEWLLFVDADVVLHHAVSAVLGQAISNDLAMLSGLGRLVMESFGRRSCSPWLPD